MAQLNQNETNRLNLVTPPVGKVGFAFDENGAPVYVDAVGSIYEFATTDELLDFLTTITADQIYERINCRRFKALLSQTGTGAPTCIVLENTLGGSFSLGRSSAGSYSITALAFNLKNVFCVIGNKPIINGVDFIIYHSGNSAVQIITSNAGIGIDNVLDRTSILIEVYNVV